MKKTEAIEYFLKNCPSPLAKLYTPDMEVQVNVAQDNGLPYVGKFNDRVWRGFFDPSEEDHDNPQIVWKTIRIPYNSDTTPEFRDNELTWGLASHAESIGMTGWDWKNRQSLWFGFDFDSITNHKAGISHEDMKLVRQEAERIPWIEVYSSTSGHGFHLYVFLEEPFPTANHNEHSALARSVLGLMSAHVGYNFSAKVDCIGSILWVWHRKQEGTRGLQLLKARESSLPVKDIPRNWKEHLSVVSGKRSKLKVNTDQSKLIKSLRAARLESSHKMLLSWFTKNSDNIWWWDTDNLMLVCHTTDLAKAHAELALTGLYATSTSGSSEYNCFAFPIKGGRWVVRRFGKGVNEHPVWSRDKSGWTKIVLNEPPSFSIAMSYHGGLLDEKGQYRFTTKRTGNDIITSSTYTCERAMQALGMYDDFKVPEELKGRDIIVKLLKENNMISIRVARGNQDADIDDWIPEKSYWLKVVDYASEIEEVELEINTDDYVRHCIQSGTDAGWFINVHGAWVEHPKQDCTSVLNLILPDLTQKELMQHIGSTILNPWELVTIPFGDEYPNDRQWNKHRAQLAFEPQRGLFPTWLKLLAHLGENLDEKVANDDFCKRNGLANGADYLFAWIASMFQYPYESLPYLFFYGEQKTGKSTLHEALHLLFKDGNGYMSAATALQNQSGFNDELNGAILAVIEEVNLNASQNKRAYNRLKEWVTGLTIAINTRFKSTFMARNTLHFIQVGNDYGYCPVYDGDTRINFIEVNTLKQEISKDVLLQMLTEEAPAFLDAILKYQVPTRESRLGLPVFESGIKQEIIEANYSELEEYIKSNCKLVKGHKILLSEFHAKFYNYLILNGKHDTANAEWKTSKKMALKLPKWSPLIKGNDSATNQVYLANISFDMEAQADGEYYLDDKKRINYKGRGEK